MLKGCVKKLLSLSSIFHTPDDSFEVETRALIQRHIMQKKKEKRDSKYINMSNSTKDNDTKQKVIEKSTFILNN